MVCADPPGPEPVPDPEQNLSSTGGEVIGTEGLGVLDPLKSDAALLAVTLRRRRQRSDTHCRLNRSPAGVLGDLVLLEVGSEPPASAAAAEPAAPWRREAGRSSLSPT